MKLLTHHRSRSIQYRYKDRRCYSYRKGVNRVRLYLIKEGAMWNSWQLRVYNAISKKISKL